MLAIIGFDESRRSLLFRDRRNRITSKPRRKCFWNAPGLLARGDGVSARDGSRAPENGVSLPDSEVYDEWHDLLQALPFAT